jgi:hypothetical protein
MCPRMTSSISKRLRPSRRKYSMGNAPRDKSEVRSQSRITNQESRIALRLLLSEAM